MAGKATFTVIDYGLETSSASFPLADFTAANYDAQIALVDALYTAIDGVSLGNIGGRRVLAEDFDLSSAPAGSAYAQRENKWLVSMTGDTSGKLYQRTIPCADLSLLEVNGEDMAAGAQRTALVAAIEAAFNGDGDETVTVNTIRFVGRNT